jgi:hypothetical protein
MHPLPSTCQSIRITDTALVVTGPGVLHGFITLSTVGAIVLDLYDNVEEAGDPFLTIKNAVNSMFQYTPKVGIAFSKGLYAKISGSTTQYVTFLVT